MSDTDNDDESTVYSKPHLNPQAVIALAASIPNCIRVAPPKGRLNNTSATGTITTYNQSKSETSYFSSDTSYFSQFSRHLQNTFSAEERDDEKEEQERPIMKNEILSFLVSDAYSIEQLAAEAEGKHSSTSELEGAGIARIDVYCQSGTVCTCRVIQTTNTLVDGIIRSDEPSSGSSFMSLLPTPRKGNVTIQTTIQGNEASTANNNQEGTQVRRIIRRKCTMKALRGVLQQPPKLPEINQSIIDGDGDNDSDDDSQASTVSKILRKRQQKRIRKEKHKFSSKLSKEQQKFLNQQQNKYETRIQRDERVREHVGNAILAGGMGGVERVDLSNMRSLSLDNNDTFGSNPSSDTMSTNEDGSISHLPTSDAYHAQIAIQNKILAADMGLAILMGEAQRLERIMIAMNENKNEDGDDDMASKQSSRARGGNDDMDRSVSTFQSTDRDYDDDSDDSSSSNDSEETPRKLARMMQGCEVEYSFRNQFHDELEGALMGNGSDDCSSSSSSEEDSDEASRASSFTSKVARSRRGRSPPSGGFLGKKHATRKQKEAILSPIIAIPTNGEGCIVLRENGAFDVIGKIPDVLHKKLFRPKGPLPDQIALGTLGRYYVHFEDGSFFFYGPPSLSKILIKGKKKRRGKDRNRDKKVDASVVSVALGKQLDDYFVVWSDGSWEAHGSLPSGLESLMNDRKDRADLLWVALGVNGEWCAKAKNGRVWWDGVSDEADEALSEILADDGETVLKFIDFGTDEAYFLLHK
mmetsp:Transcript_29615/g.62799  ORF Transcript_29615/g.62799 Transcript_29615/m.62799 type:complete len:753 (-) Transcript_29615:182-2440(-)|eukprot:CAMPEP_0172322968 /NCGR_PEP_ID=MMETSP1058-20130122/47463_1 /TAXON_ID=83371 /ORGANISM="Detonula confervacea, Strain CCMP 353" /LENGTH=752 /DNA_ID=CAMNT_0013038851 /DNA_START=161 /DNA_END=2419 /DNA_ORIENTATION=+